MGFRRVVVRVCFFFKQKTAYDLRISDWSSDVCSSDLAYASRLVRKEDYDVDPEQVRQYFAFDKVQAGMLDLAQHLFGVEIRPWATEVWAPDDSAYEMVRTGAGIGRFSFVMHPGEGKYNHAEMEPPRIERTGSELQVG